MHFANRDNLGGAPEAGNVVLTITESCRPWFSLPWREGVRGRGNSPSLKFSPTRLLKSYGEQVKGEDNGYHFGVIRDIIESRGMRINGHWQPSKERIGAFS